MPKRAKKKAAGNAAKKIVAIRHVDAPPTEPVPPVGRGFIPPSADAIRRYSKPTEPQREIAPDLATELRANTTWSTDLGPRAPEPVALADRLDTAAKWDAVYASAAPFAEYALAMRAAAWDAALRPLKKVQREFDLAVADDGKVADRFTHLANFFSVRSAQAQRGAKTRKKNRRKAKTGKPATAPAT